MEDVYQYPVFFEVPVPLTRDQRRAIEKHFLVRQKSGGGDCGSLTAVRGSVFRVAFRSQKDQQRVLQTPEQVVRCAGGTLVLRVREQQGPAEVGVSTSHTAHTMRPSLSTANTAPGASVRVETVQGTVETQQVDALVSPMVGQDPLSTLVGNTLSSVGGPRSDLLPRFIDEAGEDSMPGDAVLVEGATGLPAVFFLNLYPWDGDEEGTAVQILRLGISNILTSCGRRGFGSVALPVLGGGRALHFPLSLIARVLLEEVHGFRQDRAAAAPLLVRIVIHPRDKKAPEVFNRFMSSMPPPEHAAGEPMRMVLLGKTGSGKSALANSLFGLEELFPTSCSSSSQTKTCQEETRPVNGRSVTLIDTPGWFDTSLSEAELRAEIARCMVQCATGIHALLLVLRVDRFTEQELTTATQILHYFSEEAMKHTVVVFTHGDQLDEKQTIQKFVGENETLKLLVEKVGGRCHVFDNRHWNEAQGVYRSNRFQAKQLLGTIEELLRSNNGRCYTNPFLQEVEKKVEEEELHLLQSPGHVPRRHARRAAHTNVWNQLLIQFTGTAVGLMLGALFGAAAACGVGVPSGEGASRLLPVATGVASVMGIPMGTMMATGAAFGGVAGGVVGFQASEGAASLEDAAWRAAKAVTDRSQFSTQK